MTQLVQTTFIDQQKAMFANLVEQALPEVCSSVREIFNPTDLDTVFSTFAEPNGVDLLLTKIGTFVTPVFVLPAIGSNIDTAISSTRTPATAGTKKTKKKNKMKKRGAKKADNTAVAANPSCDQENLDLLVTTTRTKRGDPASNTPSRSVTRVPNEPISKEKNLIELAQSSRPRRKAAAKATRLAGVTKPMKSTATRSTGEIRTTRLRKATALPPVTQKATGNTPSTPNFKRKALQELVSTPSHPNTPKSPGEELRPKLDHVMPPERRRKSTHGGDATTTDALSVAASGTLQTKVLAEDVERTMDLGKRQTRARKAQSRTVGKVDDGVLPNLSLTVSTKEQNPTFPIISNVFCDSADDETPMTRKTRSKTAPKDTTGGKEVAPRLMDEKFDRPSETQPEEGVKIIKISNSELEASGKDTDKADDIMVVDNCGMDASATIIESSTSSKHRVSFAENEKGQENRASKDANSSNGNPNERANIKSPAARFRVDESGNVSDAALLDLMKIAEPGMCSKPQKNESSSMTSVALKKNLLAHASKRPPIISASRRTVSKTPGVKMPLDRLKQDGRANQQMYDEIANSLFPKSILSATSSSYELDDGQDLFKKSIFSAPSQASKKKISFASQHDNHLSQADTARKRGAESMDLSMSTPVIVKKQRSGHSSTLQGKSALRERIESVRNRMSNKSTIDAPRTPVSERQSSLTVNTVQLQVGPVKSVDRPAPSSSEVNLSKLHPRDSLRDPQLLRASDGFDAALGTPIGHNSCSSAKAQESSGSNVAASQYLKSPKSLSASERKRSFDKGSDTQDLTLSHETPASSADKHADHEPTNSRRSTPELRVKSKDDLVQDNFPCPRSSEKVDSKREGPPESAQPVDDHRSDEEVDVPSPAAEQNIQACGPTTLSNLMTSVKSFLPTTASLFGYTMDEEKEKESEQQRGERIAEESRRDAERREAEIISRREAFRLAKQAEAEEKRKRAEAKRKALALAELKREEERQRKEVERMRKLREDIDARKAKKAEEERKRELRRQRVLEHKRKVQLAEEARREEIVAKEAQERRRLQQLNGARKGGPGPSSAANVPPPPPKTPGSQRALFGLKKKKQSEEFTSYEMSVEKPNVEESSDEEDGSHHGKKRIPAWAKQSNVLKALGTQTEDPDRLFERVHSVNLEEVFASTHTMKKRYRTRNSSGQWTKDRLTAAEEMEYKKKAGFI